MWDNSGGMARDPDEPKIYLLPNLMTAGNLCCGFFATLMVFRGDYEATVAGEEVAAGGYDFLVGSPYYEKAILLIFGACLFDLLDGRLARLGGQESPFGREFDSLADIVSFGMAPAALMSRAVLWGLPNNVGWALAFVYLLCGAMRLARFNCLSVLPKKAGDKHEVRGIPIPMAAGFIASLTFLIIDVYQKDRTLGPWKYVLVVAMLGLSALMISDVRYPSFKKVGWRTHGTSWALVIAALLVVATLYFRYVMPVVLFSSYLLYGMIRPWVSHTWRREIESVGLEEDGHPDDDDDDDEDESDDSPVPPESDKP